ncbi:unnamed protein product [Cuscuta europaea]|uniref:No apical meristem-associated C-terminal domain-containing protein n=1 Tax=Cuscuta europaea TaxID=41803 RepID=A0A9P0ZSE5_CUSEU|nr:unnamed protein product [Cuscuta europaea]
MWKRIAQIWREKMETYDESCTTNSLQCHWCKILAAVNKFHALYERLLTNPKSGASQEDMRREAMRMFEDINDGQSFKYEHCWEIMKTNLKWCTKEVTRTKELSKQRAASDTDVDTKVPSTIPLTTANKEHDCINIDAPSAINGSDVERPQGRKGTKEKKGKLNEEKGVVDALNKLQTILEKQISVSEEELKMKREKNIKDFDLKEKIMKKEVELKENAHKLKENAKKLKEKDQQLKENDQKLKEKAQREKTINVF